jgi:hypothetical protein
MPNNEEHAQHSQRRARAALKENELQEAFDALWPTWSCEMKAMIYAEVLSALDLILLTRAQQKEKETGDISTNMRSHCVFLPLVQTEQIVERFSIFSRGIFIRVTQRS